MKRADRRAQLRNRQVIQPPSPEETTAMAASGVDINRGNSNQMPLSENGKAEVADIAQKLAEKGGMDRLVSTTAARGKETAQAIQQASPKGPLPERDEPNLESWAQGNLEGQPQKAVKDQIRRLIRENPRETIPGQGAMSTRPGESFDQYRMRVLPAAQGLMQELAHDPSQKIGVPVHSQTIKLVRSWLDNGSPDDFAIKPETMMQEHVEAPGSVTHLFPNGEGQWELKDVNLDDKTPLGPGIYLIRHGITPWNRENYEKSGKGQSALARVMNRAGALDFARARQIAGDAVLAGQLDQSEIGPAIDKSLPSAKDAADLPHHQLLAVVSAASPQKRQEYAGLIRERFGDLGNQPPETQQVLRDHLQAIGLG